MRKFFIAACLLAALPAVRTMPCVSEGPTHNRYMFSVFHRDALKGPSCLTDINNYWIDYCRGRVVAEEYDIEANTFYINHSGDILKTAQAKGDKAMVAYLRLLNSYLEVSELFGEDSWKYPTKTQLANRKSKALAILNAAKAYRGSALRQQYTLLQMRIYMTLGQNTANITLWTSTARKFPKTCWRDAMEGIYARALYKTGKTLEACDRYSQLGDMQSIKTLMSNYRNLAGIQAIYKINPNSPSLNFLVQDFVNNVQETVDLKPKNKDDEEWFGLIDAKCIYRKEAQQFVEFAKGVAANGKSQYPSLWLSAAGMIDYLLGNQQQAMTTTEAAVKAAGTSRMRDNARAIRLLVTTRSSVLDNSYCSYLLGELKWLDSKISVERRNPLAYDNHYSDVKDRVVHKGIEPLFNKAGKRYAALAMCSMMKKEENDFNGKAIGYSQDPKYNKYQYMQHEPWDEVFTAIDSLKANEVAEYFNYITSEPSSELERYVTERSFKDSQYFNDLIGTKYIAQGQFAEAKPYLEKLTKEFMSNQPISIYEASRDYTIERWFKHQTDKHEYSNWDFEEVTTNKKLAFCKEMIKLQTLFNLSREGNPKEEVAYKLAVRYFQASCYGDCWWLTHHYKSVTDSARSWELDFAKETVKYLTYCKKSPNESLRYHALYALAYLPNDPWFVTTYDSDWNLQMIYRQESAQFKALRELNDYALNYPDRVDKYTRKCDVIEKFRNAIR